MNTDRPYQTLDLAYRDTVIRTQARSRDTLTWLAEFLGPWFEHVEAATPTARIVLDAALDSLEGWLASSTDTGETTECFTLDAQRDPWRLRRGPGGELGAHGAGGRAAVIPEGCGTIRIRAADECHPWIRMTLLRAIREIAITRGALGGALGIHASAVAWGEGITLFAGPKRSGKSTLLLHALQGGGARLVSNDRVELRREDGRAVVRGMPTIVKLRPGSEAGHPRLQEALTSLAWYWPFTVQQSRRNARDGVRVELAGKRSRPSLSAAQVAELFESGLHAEGRVRCIVYPTVDPDWAERPGFELRPLTSDEAGVAIVEHGLLGGGRIARFLLDPAEHLELPTGKSLAHAVRALVQNVPGFALRMGPRAYDNGAMLEALKRLG